MPSVVEYRVEEMPLQTRTRMQEFLVPIGREGWELISITDMNLMIFKRNKTQ